MKNIIDISLALDKDVIVYPGNPEIEIETIHEALSIHSKIVLGSHSGTHIDSPRHISKDGVGVDAMDLDCFYGTCFVYDLRNCKEAIMVSDLENFNITAGDRVLFKTTNSERGYDNFYDNYVYLDGDAADYLASLKVSLVGIDYLSIKKRGGDDQRPHTSLLKNDIAILEGINLSAISEGEYILSAFPLKITGGDGSPVRAVLIKN